MDSIKDRRNERCGEDCSKCRQSVLCCDGIYEEWKPQKFNIRIHTFKPYFDVTLGKEVTSKKQIDDFCKENDYVYASDEELSQQCEQNRKEREEKFYSDFKQGLTERIERTLS